MTNLAGMVLSACCEHVDEIRITESVDCSTYESAETQTAMGFSQDDDLRGHVTFTAATSDTDLGFMTIPGRNRGQCLRLPPRPGRWSQRRQCRIPVTNAVPAVVAAKPGIVTLADLPPVTGRAAN